MAESTASSKNCLVCVKDVPHKSTKINCGGKLTTDSTDFFSTDFAETNLHGHKLREIVFDGNCGFGWCRVGWET